MALFIESDVRARGQKEVRKSFLKTASQIIVESTSAFSRFKSYDVFLSHSVKDSELILGMKGIIEDLGYSVYVDWVDDPELDRKSVSKETAKKLRDRMNSSKSLFFVTTENTDNSKWMPWECGYFDGIKEKVAIVPIQKTSSNNKYDGQEYLGLYPHVIRRRSKNGNEMLYVLYNENDSESYDDWVDSSNDVINILEE
jgi:uncharacterized cysteine cluster protein YcgN (CxxCxxCC family)